MVPGMLATPVPATVADGGVLPGGWTTQSNPPPAFTPIPGTGPQATPRATSKSPVAIVAGHNGQRVWVANVRSNSVGVMEAASQRFSTEIAVGAQPQALALDENDSTLVVANYASSNVSLVDARKDIVIKTQAVGAGPIQILVTHNQKAYVLCQEGKTVAVIDLKLHLLLRSISLSSRPGRMDMASSNQQIYVTLPDEDSVAVVDTGFDDVAATVKE
jgi:YVTN family beta-propeller protein